ncbi:MAG: sigma-70 family RNA polymerase sigma factor [Bacteroidota bacterium]
MNSLSLHYNTYLELVLPTWLIAIVSSTYHKSKEEIQAELVQIEKAQRDPREFASIYNRYYDEIFIYISRKIGDYDMVGEVTSRTFTKCLMHIDRYKYKGVPFSAWLYKIAMNEVRQFFRSKKHYPRSVSLSETDIAEITQETMEESRYDDAHILLPKLLGHLKEKELQIVELRFFEKKSFKEIGFILGLTEVNAKVKLYRIINKLKKIALDK